MRGRRCRGPLATALGLAALWAAALATLSMVGLGPPGAPLAEAQERTPIGRRLLLEKNEAWIRQAAALRRAGLRVLADYGRFVLAESTDPAAGRLLRDSGVTVRRELRRGVRLRRRMLTPAEPISTAPGGGLHVVQFSGPALPDWVESLASVPGLTILSVLPESAYLVWLPPGSEGSVRGMPAPLEMISPLDPGDRISPELDGTVGPARVAVYFMDTPAGRASLAAAESSWPETREAAPPMPGLLGRVTTLAPDQIRDLRSVPEMIWMEPWGDAAVHDEVSTLLSAGLVSGALPAGPHYRQWLSDRGLDDLSGMVIQIVDTGVDSGLTGPEHPALAGRVLAAFNETGEMRVGDCPGHGTHIAGIIAGNAPAAQDLADASGYSYGLGLAPTARLVSSRIFGCSGKMKVTRSFTEILTEGWNAGARISNNSWGQGGPSYTALAREFDAIVRDVDGDPENGEQPMVVVASAGNAGPKRLTVTTPAVAKNVVTVGGSESVRPETTDGCFAGPEEADDAGHVWDSSSRGPTTDGRTKPDLMAPASHIVSTVSQSDSYDGSGLCNTFYPPGQHLYTWSSGTSQSAAHVSGAAALFMEDYRREHGVLPSPAMVKAAMVASATDLGDENLPTGPQPFRPTSMQGWGRVNLDNLVGRRLRSLVDQSHRFTSSGQEYVRGPLRVADPARPVAVALVWTDAPGTPAGSAWVNDLDLEVETGTEVFLGNVLEQGFSVPGGSHDTRNNIEAVFIAPGDAQEVTIRVTAVSLPGDGVPSAPGLTDQDFALYVDNVIAPEAEGRLHLDRREVSCTGSLDVLLTDSGLSGGGRAVVRATSPGEPGGESFDLTEFPLSSGVFRGSVPLATGPAAADGALQVVDGQEVVIAYEDDDTGDGSGAVVEVSAVARCTSLQISNARVERLGDTEAVVAWSTGRPADSTVSLDNGVTRHDPALVTDHRVVLTGLTPCSTRTYSLTSVDASGSTARFPAQGSRTFSTGNGLKVPVFHDDLEHFRPDWSHGGAGDDWELGQPQVGPSGAASGHRAWGTDLDGTYAMDADSWLRMPPVDLLQLRDAALVFRHFVDIPQAVLPGDPQDGAWVEVSLDGGGSWIVLEPDGGYPVPAGEGNPHIPTGGGVFAGSSTVWSETRFDLSHLRADRIHVRFRLWRDPGGSVQPGTGWLLDDIGVEGAYPCGRGTLLMDSDAYGCTSRVGITLADEDVDRNPQQKGLASVIAESPLGLTGIQLRETGLDTGVYTGTLLLSPSVLPGTLQVFQGDTIVVRYQDNDDGTSSPATVSSQAEVVDCTAPSPPGSPLISRGDDGRLIVKWIDPPEADLAEIRVHYDSDGSGPSYNGTGASEGASPLRADDEVESALLSGLPECVDHFISLTSVDSFGNESGFSTEVVGAPFQGTPCSRASIALAGAEGAGCGQQVPIRVDDGNADPDLATPGSIDVLASSGTSPVAMTISLPETGPDTGVFTGLIPLSPIPASGTLQVSEGDVLEVVYSDADTGGGAPSPVRASVPVDDCVAPSILNLSRSRLGRNEIGLSWETDEPAESLLEFGLDPGLESSLPGPPDVTVHSALLPSLPDCSNVYYRVTAVDRRGNTSVADDQGFPFHLGTSRPITKLEDDFEGGAPGWSTGGSQNEWELGTPAVGPPPPPSGTFVWGTDLDGSYEAGADLHLTSPEVDLTGLEGVTLTFMHWYDIFTSTAGGGFDDGAWLEVSSDNGATWDYIEPEGGYPDTLAGNPYLLTGTPVYAGTTTGWELATFDLDRFSGQIIRIRFHLWQDIFDPPQPGLGWYIDDVVVQAAAPCHQGGVHLEPGSGACGGSPLRVLVWDVDADADPLQLDTVTVQLTSPSDPLPTDVTLVESGPSTGEFSGLASFGSAQAPGELTVTDGDLITALYDDQDDGTGLPAAARAFHQVGDCTLPVISGVQWRRLGPSRLLVMWETDEPATSEIRDPGGTTLVASSSLTRSHSLVLGGLSPCTVSPFQVASVDSGGNLGVAPGGALLFSPEGNREIAVLEEGFESGAAGWAHGGDPDEWEVGPPQSGPGAAFAGQSVAGTGLAGPYSRDRVRIGHETWLVSPTFSLGGLTSASLSLMHFFSFPETTQGDGGIVEILARGRWRTLTPSGGYPGEIRTDREGGTRGAFVNSSGGWVNSIFNLSDYLGEAIRFRLRLHVDHGTPVPSDGWYVDEIRVTGTVPCSRGTIELDRNVTNCEPGSLGIQLADTDLNADPGFAEQVTVEASSPGGSVPLALSETGADTGVFRGQIGYGPAGAGRPLVAVEGGLLEVTYEDDDDGSGAPAISTDSALVADCDPPDIQRVRGFHLPGGNDLEVTWETDEPSTSRAVLQLPGHPDRVLASPASATAHRLVFHDLPACSPYSLILESADAAGNLAVAAGSSPPFAGEVRDYNLLLEDDMEGPANRWSSLGNESEWERGAPTVGPPAAISGTQVMGTDLDDLYNFNADSILRSPPLDLTGLSSATLRFWHFYDIFASGTPNADDDGVWIEIWHPDDPVPSYVRPVDGYNNTIDRDGDAPIPGGTGVFAGNSRGWQLSTVDLTPFTGSQIRVQFRLWNDAAEGIFNRFTGAGWYLDDVKITSPGSCHPGPALASMTGGAVKQGDTDAAIELAGAELREPLALEAGAGISFRDIALVSSGTVTARMDVSGSATTGPRSITVTNPDGQSASLEGAIMVGNDPARADMDGSGAVDGRDLAILARAFATFSGDVRYDPVADLDGDGAVDGVDLALLAASFGRTFSP